MHSCLPFPAYYLCVSLPLAPVQITALIIEVCIKNFGLCHGQVKNRLNAAADPSLWAICPWLCCQASHKIWSTHAHAHPNTYTQAQTHICLSLWHCVWFNGSSSKWDLVGAVVGGGCRVPTLIAAVTHVPGNMCRAMCHASCSPSTTPLHYPLTSCTNSANKAKTNGQPQSKYLYRLQSHLHSNILANSPH